MVSELTGDDRDLLDRLAVRVVDLHMEVPAVLAIETGKPLSLLASQDRKSTRLNSSHIQKSRMPSSA